MFSRILGVIFSPQATFERIVASPTVLGVLLVCGVAVGLGQGLPQLTEAGQEAALNTQAQQFERFTGRPVTDEERAAMLRRAPIGAYTTIAFAPVGLAVGILFFAGLYFVIFNAVLGGTATFKQVMSVSAHSTVIAALGALLAAPVHYFQGTANPMGPFTLGALLPMLDENTFLARFLGFVSVFSIWGTIVTAIGLAVLYRRKTGSVAIGLFMLTAVFAAIGATVMGFFSR